jgi:tetratricopeptide (TPR) repeat protein
MVKGKKITKKKLKEPDEFITFTERSFLFIKAHLRKIAAAGIVLLVILLSVALFLMWEKRKEAEASQKFGLATEIYQRVTSPSSEASATDYKSALEKFDEIVKSFPKTSAGRFSLLYEGNIHLRLGEYEEAVKAYSAFVEGGSKEKLYRYFAMEGLGHAYEGKKEYEKALQAYQKVLEMGDGFQIADAYLNMGICYEKLGKAKEALENYKSFLKNAPKSPMVNAVMRKISLLE